MATYHLANPEFMYPAQEQDEGHWENYYDNKHIARSLWSTRLLSSLSPYLSRSNLSALTTHFKQQQEELVARGFHLLSRTMLNHTAVPGQESLFYILVDYRKESAWLSQNEEIRLSDLNAFPCKVSGMDPEFFLYYTLNGEMVVERLKHYSIHKYLQDGQRQRRPPPQEDGTAFFKQLKTNWVKVSEIDIAETEDLFATSASLFFYSSL